MYLMQLFLPDNITIHLGSILEPRSPSSSGEVLEGKKRKGCNNLISDLYKVHSCVPSSSSSLKPVFLLASTVNSCLPCCSEVSPEFVVYALKNKRLILQSRIARVISSVKRLEKEGRQ